MPTALDLLTVNDAFFAPITGLAEASPNTRPCPELSDSEWIRIGIQRVLEDVPSGRGFLQEHGPRFAQIPKHSNYFSSLHSARRGAVLEDVSIALLDSVGAEGTDRLGHIPELASYVCFAVDAHWHLPATHDPRYDGKKASVGHSYSLNLHDHLLHHLATAEGEHEHDMSMLKRIKPSGLRQGVPQGKRVLVIYDRAGIDLAFWKRCRQETAVYFLSRMKSNMVFEWVEESPWDRSDPRNRGVLFDQWVLSREGHPLRLIEYREPETGELIIFLTNDKTLPPGVLVELYRRRWEVEKVFDDIKNKLGEKKAWGTSQQARTTQAQFVALTYNLLVHYERRIEEKHNVQNVAEDARRKTRIRKLSQASKEVGRAISTLLQTARNATQRSVKFIRWLRQALRDRLAEAAAVARLSQLYATM